MVEFGLKLDDNKVSEWNEHYIQYEKLKSILVRASTAVKKLEDFKSKRPATTAAIIQAYKSGVATPFQSTVDLVGQDTITTTAAATSSNHAAMEVAVAMAASVSRTSLLNTITEEK